MYYQTLSKTPADNEMDSLVEGGEVDQRAWVLAAGLAREQRVALRAGSSRSAAIRYSTCERPRRSWHYGAPAPLLAWSQMTRGARLLGLRGQ